MQIKGVNFEKIKQKIYKMDNRSLFISNDCCKLCLKSRQDQGQNRR